MLSAVSVTYEIDDLARAAEELTATLDSAVLAQKSVCGILFCFSDMDQEGLVSELKKRFPHDIIGCTCIANMDREDGFHEMAVTFTVLGADDCTFATAVSGPVSPGNVAEEVDKACQTVRAALQEDPGLVIAFPPYKLEIMADAFSHAFNASMKGVPVIGGLPSYNARGDSNLTLHNDHVFADKLVMLAISGNVKPVFAIRNVAGSPIEKKRQVTRAKHNTVYSVGEQTLVEYFREVGIPVERMVEGNASLTFLAHPLLLENVEIDGEGGNSFMRTLHKIDLEEGSGTAIGEIPEGATLSICSLDTGQIRDAAQDGMEELAAKMRAVPGYDFSTLFAISCIGRYLLLTPESGAEVANILKKLPSGMSLNGFYSYGEFAPVQSESGKMLNFAHNESLVLCAF